MKKKEDYPKAPPLPALTLAGSTRQTYYFSRILFIAAVVLAVVICFVPWRQYVTGNGRVIAYNPLDRRVNVEALLEGRVKHLYVVEGDIVKKGDIIAEIEDNDPNLLGNLRSQKEAIRNRMVLNENRVVSIEMQMTQLKQSKRFAMSAAKEMVIGLKAKLVASELEYDRIKVLFEKGIAARREWEQIQAHVQHLTANLAEAEAKVSQTRADYDSNIASLEAQRDQVKGEVELSKNELAAIDIRVKQTERQIIRAPRDGRVLKVVVTDGTYLKPGEIICSIIPITDSRFVEIWLDGNDIALIKEGTKLRLTFEGYPSVQTMGWPHLAVGTFGGEVVFIDSTDNGEGLFRVVVGPDIDTVDRYDGAGKVDVGWPDKDRWLRQGTLAQAWFMLEEVPLWAEFWRQMNGFPPLIVEDGSVDPTL